MRITLGKQLLLALLSAVLLAWWWPEAARRAAFLGKAFLLFLEWFAPVIVFCTVFTAIAGADARQNFAVRRILLMYFCSMIGASLTAVTVGLLWPGGLVLPEAVEATDFTPRSNVFSGLILIGLMAAGIGLGLLMRNAGAAGARLPAFAKKINHFGLRLIMILLPLGIFGICCRVFVNYDAAVFSFALSITLYLVASSLAVGFLVNPAVFFIFTGRSPWASLRDALRLSAFPALLSRSSIVNLPVNLAAADQLGVPKKIAGLALPIGAVLDMPGAVVSIAGMTLCGVTAGGQPDLMTLLIIAAGSTGCALLAAGIPSGSAVLLPGMLNIAGADPAVYSLVLAVYFMAGLLQDAVGTALNSSSDLFFALSERRPTPDRKDLAL